MTSGISQSSDEEDYMSDSFLKNLVDVRPGLYSSRKVVQEREIAQRNGKKSLRLLEQERLEEGLKASVGSDNKGYAMLTKMGYCPGKGLGAKGEGRKEPVAIELRKFREGFGALEDRKRTSVAIGHEKCKQLRYADELHLTFRSAQSKRFQSFMMQQDLLRGQRICAELDCAAGHTVPPLNTWYWPRDLRPQHKNKCSRDSECVTVLDKCDNSGDGDDADLSGSNEEELDDMEETTETRLACVMDYLRHSYSYCLWCCCRFENESDLLQNCPGCHKDDHG